MARASEHALQSLVHIHIPVRSPGGRFHHFFPSDQHALPGSTTTHRYESHALAVQLFTLLINIFLVAPFLRLFRATQDTNELHST